MKKIIIIGMCMLLMVLVSGCVNVYPYYVERKGAEACQYCFGEYMRTYKGGSVWSEITCEGEHNKLTMWAGDEPEDVTCHNRDNDCREETMFLYHTTTEDYNCKQIEIMMNVNSYVTINKEYYSKKCFSNETYWVETHSTGECASCAKDEWVKVYLDECMEIT